MRELTVKDAINEALMESFQNDKNDIFHIAIRWK